MHRLPLWKDISCRSLRLHLVRHREVQVRTRYSMTDEIKFLTRNIFSVLHLDPQKNFVWTVRLASLLNWEA